MNQSGHNVRHLPPARNRAVGKFSTRDILTRVGCMPLLGRGVGYEGLIYPKVRFTS